jgi:hypothetical protein
MGGGSNGTALREMTWGSASSLHYIGRHGIAWHRRFDFAIRLGRLDWQVRLGGYTQMTRLGAAPLQHSYNYRLT